MLGLSGYGIIALAWLIQLSSANRGQDQMRATFILTYGIGTALLLVDSASYGFSTIAWMHLVVLLVVGLTYLKTHQ